MLQGPRAARSLSERRAPLADPKAQLQRLVAVRGSDGAALPTFAAVLAEAGWDRLTLTTLEVFQVNVGKLCNMACRHCHVDAGPDRGDVMMDDATVDAVIAAMARAGAKTLDITGGAPELHPRFRDLVQAGIDLGMHVMDRCNLTVLTLPRFADLPQWLAARGVEVVASLPHYRARNTDAQRGKGTYQKSIAAIRMLNEVGYGQGDPKRVLTLVSNPAGAFLGAGQATLQREWQEALAREHGVSFDRLLVLNNMPIARYLEWLEDSGNTEAYMRLLVHAFNPATIAGLMCRNTISVSWDGRLYDCDFNQMLALEAEPVGTAATIHEFDLAAWQARRVVTAPHCFGCTAGAGSSCGGQMV